MKTLIHTYYFDMSKPTQAQEYKTLCENLKAQGLHVFRTHSFGSGDGHYHFVKDIDGQTIALDRNQLFDNQWNTKPIDGKTEKGLRVFDWAEDYPINFPKNIKRGHYLTQTSEMREIRQNTVACGYCGKQESAGKGHVFCPHCISSEYLTTDMLHLTRMQAVSDTNTRKHLTDAEKAHIMPIYTAAQIYATTERNKKQIIQARQNVASEYKKTIEAAKTKHDGLMWILERDVNVSNVIYYAHTGKFCFGWRSPISSEVESKLIDILREFPFDYEIKKGVGK